MDCWKQTTKKASFTSLLINYPVNLSISTTSYFCLYIFSPQRTRSISHTEKQHFYFLLAIICFKEVCQIDKKIVSTRIILICIVLMPILIQTGRITKSSNSSFPAFPPRALWPLRNSWTSSKSQKSETGLLVHTSSSEEPWFLRTNTGCKTKTFL